MRHSYLAQALIIISLITIGCESSKSPEKEKSNSIEEVQKQPEAVEEAFGFEGSQKEMEGKILELLRGYKPFFLPKRKVASTGNQNILLTERGTSFGYGLVSDMTSIPAMQHSGYPVVFDATHSAQIPSGEAITGGQRDMIPTLAKAAVAVGCDGLFMEVHNDPEKAKSDAATQWPLDQLESLLISIQKIHRAVI